MPLGEATPRYELAAWCFAKTILRDAEAASLGASGAADSRDEQLAGGFGHQGNTTKNTVRNHFPRGRWVFFPWPPMPRRESGK